MEATSKAGRIWRIGKRTDLSEGSRLHTVIDGRYITAFRNRGVISSIDSVCHHAGGPMTLGPLTDIEELGVTVSMQSNCAHIHSNSYLFSGCFLPLVTNLL